MPINKNAQLRYQILDRCFSDFLHKYTTDNLIDEVNEALMDLSGTRVSIRQICEDNKFIRDRVTFNAPIEVYPCGSRKCLYGFGTRSDNENEGNFYELEKFVETEDNHYAFFISMQYIRLSELVNAKTLAKNKSKQDTTTSNSTDSENEKLKANILNADWDLIIIDEAHEGTRTSLGKSVIDDFLKKSKTKMLYLSGTPFNLYEDFDENEIYTWDYVAEQQAKNNWTKKHPDEKNPYAELPKMNLFTYDIRKNFDTYHDDQGIFTFTEFFRTWTGNPKADNPTADKNTIPMPAGAKGRFVHEADVLKFLNLLCAKDAENNFPFSTTEYRQMFRHTLWVVSHVNEAAALEQLLKEHPIFKRFNIVNVAGKNDSDEQSDNALDKVLNAIGELPEKTSTITILCGRLTTGVTVTPWTAVLYLKEEFRKRITNIRGIALRIPLLMYGGADAGDTKEDITVDNFTRKIKEESWNEFMSKGISKEEFNRIKKCFNATRFEEAGKKYRALTREADYMHVDERIRQITEIFSYFRNPDKETVLTPWRVVNMHMSDTIGGWCFYDESFDEKTGQLDTPRYVDQGDVTRQLFDNVNLAGEIQTKILEINSKTGLYPLYITYSLYRRRLDEYIKAECIDRESVSVQEEQVVWDDIVKDNIYVICNTPMAVGITRRTLFGFRNVERKANIKNVPLIERASNDQEGLVKELKSVGFWKGNTSKQEMKFNAVVGNPPYQMGINKEPAYHYFIDLGRSLCKIGTTIHPARFLFNAGKTPTAWNEKMLHDEHYQVVKYWNNPNDVFDKVDIKGGVAITMWNEDCDYGEIGLFVNQSELLWIKNKVTSKKFKSFSDIVYPRDLYRLTNSLYEENS